jgi:RNA polymerase sigma-70 factor (ECF subfamily)
MEASRAAVPAPARNTRSLLRLRPSADKALEQLYKRHARDVYQYALALLTNPADAEDVTQTTFLNAYRALQRGDRPHRPHNWLIAIAHNVCRMRWRQAGHRPREVSFDDAPEPVAPEHDRPSIDDVLRALSRLSFNQRSALVMRELEGRSCREIAEMLGLSVSAVEALLFRARRRLQIERKALGVLGTAPLPGQLASALGLGGGGGGGGAVATGLAAITSDAVLKTATALVVIGAAASGAIAISKPAPAYRPATPPAVTPVKQTHKATTSKQAKRARAQLRAHPTSGSRPADPQSAETATEGGTAPQGASDPGSGSASQLPTVPAPPAVQVPTLPAPPASPVDLPPVELPSLPVGLAPVPPAPPLPPLPPL